MPKVHTRDSDSFYEMVMTATRGPDVDQDNERLKLYTACVIRFWIEGWSYGSLTPLPFVVFPRALNEKIFEHYEEHIYKAAGALQLPVLYISQKVWKALPFPPRQVQVLDGPLSEWHLWARGWISAFTKTGAFDEQGE